MTSPFLDIPEGQWVAHNALAFAIRDKFPVSPGHTLVIPRRLVRTWFEATVAEQQAIFELVDAVKRQLDDELRPHGYNVGFNAGEAAGQTVFHLHVHVIPRFAGDVPDPRGGIRHVIPTKGNYLATTREPPLVTGGADPFLRHLLPLFARATDIAIVAAFVQDSGLADLERAVLAALARGARLRVVTGDYLAITQVQALETLLGWSCLEGSFETRVIEVERLAGPTRSFHPKSWRFEGPDFGVAFVGSSNISRGALGAGIEWNLRAERARDEVAYTRVARAFEELWPRATALTAEWIAGYARRARAARLALPPGEVDAAPLPPPPEPTGIQREALAALVRSRAEGHRRALTVLATGLGKTWLAAFDAESYGKELGRCPRLLVLAHREELLTQAATTFRRMLRRSFPDARTTWCAGKQQDLSGELVLASVQKLSRPEALEALARQRFDHVVVDEVHHADAPSYRRILDRLQCGFLLGLSATPERADDGDVIGLFDDHVPFRADMGVGIQRGLLVPFAYFGLEDDVDYANIPWRNRRFDPTALAEAVQTQRRMERLWTAWQAHPGARTLVFCCSIEHAHFARDWLRARGVRAVAVHSGPGSDDRDTALDDLRAGAIDAVCSVDLFNEGVDVREVDRVVMLRPTESSVVFLQQLGRGLRTCEGKTTLTVIDFVGNHRVFLARLRLLVSLGEQATPLRAFLADETEPELPPGCSVDVELEAKRQLLELLGPSGRSEIEHAYREIHASRDARPTVSELFHLGYRPSTLRKAHGSWFEFVASEGHLMAAEQRTLAAAKDWLDHLESTAMSKSFKMVVLEALLEEDALTGGLPLDTLATRSHEILLRSPELFRDLADASELGDPRAPDPARWRAYWRKNPIAAWLGESRQKSAERLWFRLEGDRLVPRFAAPAEDAPTLAAMTRELVDYRLAQYRARGREEAQGAAFECKLIGNPQGNPILKLPSRAQRKDVPEGETVVRVAPEGKVWQFRFMKEFCNVARPAGEERNRLPDLMRGWFGLAAGRPSTAFSVRFSRSPDGWWVEPAAGAQVLQLPTRRSIRAFPTLRAAAGAAAGAWTEAPEAEAVTLPTTASGEDVFAVRAAGDSMDGGATPIRDGDWLVLRLARGAGLGALAGRVTLVETIDEGFQVKRLVRDGERWLLRSDNPARPSFVASERTVPIAVLVETIRPESLGPAVGSEVAEDQLAQAFGLTRRPEPGARTDGHLFALVDRPGLFTAPDRLAADVAPGRRPGETLFVLVRADASWRYLGVARWSEDEARWASPELDLPTWRALGGGREASRRLPPGARQRAEALVATVKPGWLEHGGKRLRIVGTSPKGGLRVDGGPGGFAERSVSLTDLAWALVARDDVARSGGALDEARVNRLRYLEGTPKGSTRWIDTAWALVVVGAARP